jgi:probable rRNA maturation factor
VTRLIEIDISETQPAGCTARPPDASIIAWVQAALEEKGILPGGDFEVAVLIAGIETVRALNRDYRGKDRPTNVLSFPADDVVGLPPGAPRPLGDIVLCAEVISSEADQQGKQALDHWAHLCVHGALHLAGFDHENVADAEEMEALETRILRGMGIPDPYSSR